MRCNLKKPEACFNCPFPDCVNKEEADKTELYLVERYHAPALDGKKKHKKEYRKAYHQTHKSEIKEYMKKYQAKHKERLKAYRRAYYLAHREEELERQKRYDRMKKGAENAS